MDVYRHRHRYRLERGALSPGKGKGAYYRTILRYAKKLSVSNLTLRLRQRRRVHQPRHVPLLATARHRPDALSRVREQRQHSRQQKNRTHVRNYLKEMRIDNPEVSEALDAISRANFQLSGTSSSCPAPQSSSSRDLNLLEKRWLKSSIFSGEDHP